MKHSAVDTKNFKKKKWKIWKPLGEEDLYNLTMKDMRDLSS